MSLSTTGTLATGVFAGLLLARLRSTPTQITIAPFSELHAIISRCPSLRSYRPTPWLPGPHLNTVFALTLRGYPGVVFTRTWLRLPDGGHVSLDWSSRPKRGQPVLVILHGLTGGSHERYVQWLVASAETKLGICCVVMNARGCGGTALSTPQSFSASWTGDIRITVKAIRAVIGENTPILAAGFSLGAGILTKFLAEDGLSCDVTTAVALCASYDFVKNVSQLESWFTKNTYNRAMAKGLVEFFKQHRHVFAPPAQPSIDWQRVAASRTCRDFDATVIVPMFGYRDTDAYYADASVGPLMDRIAIPTLMLNARDDPICAASCLPEETVYSNPNLVAVVSAEGGHVAWCSGWWPIGASWDNTAAVEWYCAMLQRQIGGETKLTAARTLWERSPICDLSTVLIMTSPVPITEAVTTSSAVDALSSHVPPRL